MNTERNLGRKFDKNCAFNKMHGTVTKETGSMGKKCGKLEEKAIQLCKELPFKFNAGQGGWYSSSNLDNIAILV